jgi:catechol 2,3-dioxygenase-like lactoylglutathione lyase family enzyme
MVKSFDHITIVVHDIEAAKRFFALHGFKETKSVVISGKVMEDYMGIKDIEADHVTLAIENPHTEVQLLHYHRPGAIADADIGKLNKLGFNHICFAVDDLDSEVAKLTAAGVKLRNKVMEFHNRKLVFLHGPEDITVELAQWH